MASYEFSENFKATVNAEYVTDEKYINSLYWAQGFYAAHRPGKLSLTRSL